MNPFVVNGRPTALAFMLLTALAVALAFATYDWGHRFLWPPG